jgi:hypothetical protein
MDTPLCTGMRERARNCESAFEVGANGAAPHTYTIS